MDQFDQQTEALLQLLNQGEDGDVIFIGVIGESGPTGGPLNQRIREAAEVGVSAFKVARATGSSHAAAADHADLEVSKFLDCKVGDVRRILCGQLPLPPKPEQGTVSNGDGSQGPLHPHTLGHILSELHDWQRDDPELLGRANIENELSNLGYGPACFDQVCDAWFTANPPAPDKHFEDAQREPHVPMDIDPRVHPARTILVEQHGPAEITVESTSATPMELPAINMRVYHEFGDNAVAMNGDEAWEVIHTLWDATHAVDLPAGGVEPARLFALWEGMDIEEKREFAVCAIQDMADVTGEHVSTIAQGLVVDAIGKEPGDDQR